MGFPVSQREGEQTAPAPARAMPGASSSFKCCLPGASARAFSSSETLCNVWKGSTLAQLVGVCWGRGALCLPPRLPSSPHVQAWPSSLFPFTQMVDTGSLSMLAALSPTSLYRSMVLSPWALATPSGFGVPAFAPSSDSEAVAGSSCCPKEKRIGGEWLFLIKSNLKKKVKKLFFLAYSHQTAALLWPKPYSFLWTKRVGCPSPWGLE